MQPVEREKQLLGGGGEGTVSNSSFSDELTRWFCRLSLVFSQLPPQLT